MTFDVNTIMSRNPPKPPSPLIPWQEVRADIPFFCTLEGPEIIAVLREFMASGRAPGVTFTDARGGGIPKSDWIDWQGFPI